MNPDTQKIIDRANAAKCSIGCADIEPIADEYLIRAATAYGMLERHGLIATPRDALDLPTAIFDIAANFADVTPSTPQRAAMFATVLEGES